MFTKKAVIKTLLESESNGQQLFQQFDFQGTNQDQTNRYSLFWSDQPIYQLRHRLPTYQACKDELMQLPLASLIHLWQSPRHQVEVAVDTFGELAGEPQYSNI